MAKLGKQLGTRIYRFRKQRGLTQAALAEKGRISNEFMSSIERGAKLPSLTTLQAIAQALRVGLKDLFNFDQAGFRRIEPLSREALDVAIIVDGVPPHQRRRISKIVKILADSKGE